MIRIAGINPFSLINGDGIRIVIFVQGCKHHCKGCQNPDTWDMGGGDLWDVNDLARHIKDMYYGHPYDGITLSGGDPFYQQESCVELLKLLPGIDVWCYTGFSFEEIEHTELASMCDVIVDGQYVELLRCEGAMYGSSNQRIIRKENDDK